MSWCERFAVLLDGEYVKKTLWKRSKRDPDSSAVMSEVKRIRATGDLAQRDLYRVFYYTADPLAAKAMNPLTRETVDFGATPVHQRNTRLIDQLENQRDVAVRRGTLAHQGWEIGKSAMRALTLGQKQSIEAADLVPKIVQKGVDVRIGLDIASLSLKRLVNLIVLVTGDADLVPAMKFARREGVRLYLDTLGAKHVRAELKVHADVIL